MNEEWQSLFNVQKLLFQDMESILARLYGPSHGCNMFIVKLKNLITFNYKKTPLFYLK